MSEPLMRLLADLPVAEPNPARAERVRKICRTRLTRSSGRASSSGAVAGRSRAADLWRPLVACLGVAYLAEVIVLALGVYGRL